MHIPEPMPAPRARRGGGARRRWVRVALACLLLTAAGGAWFWRQWTAPYTLPPVPPNLTPAAIGLNLDAEMETAAGQGPPEDLAGLKAAVLRDPENLVYGNKLRGEFLRRESYEELQTFWRIIPDPGPKAHIQAALSLIDAMQDPHSGNSNLGRNSMEAAGHFDKAIAENPYNWLAHYARGLNHLYWPVGFKRVDKAVSDLTFALALQKALPDQTPQYFAFTYAALGDALVKRGDISAGIRVWEEGLGLYPASLLLRRRVETGAGGAVELVRSERGIEDFVRPQREVTDLSSLWEKRYENVR